MVTDCGMSRSSAGSLVKVLRWSLKSSLGRAPFTVTCGKVEAEAPAAPGSGGWASLVVCGDAVTGLCGGVWAIATGDKSRPTRAVLSGALYLTEKCPLLS
jgi:hypothetical protein